MTTTKTVGARPESPRALLVRAATIAATREYFTAEEVRTLRRLIKAEQTTRPVSPPLPAKVWVVYTEWNRPHDCDGGCTIDAICATEEMAKQAQLDAIDNTKGINGNLEPFYDPRTPDAEENPDWDFDVHIEEREVRL